MKTEIDGMIGGLAALKSEIQAAEQERTRVQEEVREVHNELTARRAALEEVKRISPGDELETLDYQSTLAQFEDASPNALEEIAHFLRARRIDPGMQSNFSPDAVPLARHLGIPMDHVIGSEERIARFACESEVYVPGLVFSLCLPHTSCGLTTALEFDCGASATCTVFAKFGAYEESLSNQTGWSEVWTGEVRKGWNNVPINLHLKDGQTYSLYLACSSQKLACSAEEPTVEHTEPVLLAPGRIMMQRFQWPHKGAESYLNHRPYYFVGHIKYTHYIAPSKGF